MFRTTHIRTKLAVALAVPLVALVAIAGFEVYDAAQEVSSTRSQADLATSSIGPGSLLISLQDERNRAAIDLIGLGASAQLAVATNEEARTRTDAAIGDLQAEVQGRSSEVTATFAPAWEALNGLQDLRADIDGFTGPMDLTNDEFANEVFNRYTAIVEAFFDSTSTAARAVDDAALRNGVEIIDAAARQSEMRARIVRSVVLATVTGTAKAAAPGQEVAALYDRGRGFDTDIRSNATGAYAGIGDATFSEPGVQSFNRQVETFLAGQDVNLTDLLTAVKSEPDIGYIGLRARASSVLSAEADRIESAAVARERVFGGIALGALLIALFVTWMASRSITRPLRALRTQAEDMATHSLPSAVRQILDTPPGEDVVIPEVDPVAVRSRDEVAQVAAALSAVQASAVELAVEQAVLRRNISDSYINLGRRNQNLLSRQLDFITELERNESDPDTLEGLFRLDHLATRMRRNAESLLVLAGIEPPRQWSAPVKVSDVVRAALGEVEDYQRVVVRHLEPASITGAVAADVAHVLAELIENALSFSPPEQSVEVKGRLTTGGYTVAITDNGLGMAADDLARANRRLAGKESFTVAPSRYLGHYVAGHLASRLGVVVELQDSPAGGITARVDVPMGLLANDETDPRLVGVGTVDVEGARPAVAELEDLVGLPPAPAHAPTSDAGAQPLPTRSVPEPAAVEEPAAPAMPEPATTSLTPSGLPRRGDRRPDAAEPARAAEDERPTLPTRTPAASVAESPASDQPPLERRRPVPLTTSADASESSTVPAGAVEALQPSSERAPLPARGFGGLAVARPAGGSMYSVAAQQARNGSHEPDGAPTTPTGLARRVPGAQRPDVSALNREPAAPAPVAAPVAEPARSTPEDVYSFLSSFQSGVARGRADANAETGTETMEDGR